MIMLCGEETPLDSSRPASMAPRSRSRSRKHAIVTAQFWRAATPESQRATLPHAANLAVHLRDGRRHSMTEPQDLLVERRDGVLYLTLNRPDRMNALSPPMVSRLLDELHA